MDQAAGQLRAGVHLHHPVVDVAQHPRLGGQFDPLGGMHVAIEAAVDHHHRRMHFAFDAALLGQHQHRRLAIDGGDLADDAALDIQPAAEFHIATDGHVRADQGVDRLAVTRPRFLLEHSFVPRSFQCPRERLFDVRRRPLAA